jgi:hypothetical protein
MIRNDLGVSNKLHSNITAKAINCIFLIIRSI